MAWSYAQLQGQINDANRIRQTLKELKKSHGHSPLARGVFDQD
jgi:hypothetical protein